MKRERLMNTPPQFVLSRLSRELYSAFLAKAQERGFSFVRFQDFLPGAEPLPPRYIALRHDIGSAVIETEAWVGINATIRDGRRVGAHAVVGMDASVQRDISDHAVTRASRPAVESRADDDHAANDLPER